MRTGSKSAAKSFAPVSRSRRWIPSRDSKNAIDDQLQDATSVLDAFHIVKLAGDAPGEVRRRVQQDTTGHRGRKGDPLYQIRNLLRASRDRLTKRQKERLREAFTADEAHISVEVAYLHRASARGLPSRHTRPRPTPGRSSHREPTKVFHPRDRSPGPDPTQVEGRLLGLLRYRRSKQRPNRSHQRNHRAGQTRRQRLPQPHQRPTPNAPHRRRPRRLHPHSTLKSPSTESASVMNGSTSARVAPPVSSSTCCQRHVDRGVGAHLATNGGISRARRLDHSR